MSPYHKRHQPLTPDIGGQHRQAEPVGQAKADPLVAAAAQGGRRAGGIGDAAVAAAKTRIWVSLSNTTRSGMRGGGSPAGGGRSG